MADTRALDEPLTESELDQLEAFLASDAVPQDCMDLEMLDGYLAAVVSGPEMIQPSEWLPQVWSEGNHSAAAAFANKEEAQQIMALVLRHMSGIQRTLSESPTRFKPLLYLPEGKAVVTILVEGPNEPDSGPGPGEDSDRHDIEWWEEFDDEEVGRPS